LVKDSNRHAAPSVRLKSGWSQVTVRLDDTWLPEQVRAAAEQVEWTLTADDKKASGWVVFDNFRIEREEPQGEGKN
jgi:hypothetical protein